MYPGTETYSCNYDGLVKSPISSFRFTEKGLNVLNVRLALSQFARLELEAFYETVRTIYA